MVFVKGRKLTDEEKRLISIRTKEAMKRPEVRNKYLQGIKNNKKVIPSNAFLKGHTPWCKGKNLSKEHIEKMVNTRRTNNSYLKGENHSSWKGGRRIKQHGYVVVYNPSHPYNMLGYVYEHRLNMEIHLGRVLLPTEVVHHINGNKQDNRIENLMVFNNNGEHTKYHKEIKCLKEGKL